MIELDLKLLVQIVLASGVVINNMVTIKHLREAITELKAVVAAQAAEIVKLKVKTGVE